MGKFIFSSLVLILVSSCSIYDYQRFNGEDFSKSACSNPEYIATIGKSAITFQTNANGQRIKDADGDYITKFNPESLTLLNLLNDARAAHGKDVTIQNVRYDVKNGKKKVSVIYDVVKCK